MSHNDYVFNVVLFVGGFFSLLAIYGLICQKYASNPKSDEN